MYTSTWEVQTEISQKERHQDKLKKLCIHSWLDKIPFCQSFYKGVLLGETQANYLNSTGTLTHPNGSLTALSWSSRKQVPRVIQHKPKTLFYNPTMTSQEALLAKRLPCRIIGLVCWKFMYSCGTTCAGPAIHTCMRAHWQTHTHTHHAHVHTCTNTVHPH